MPIIKTLSFVAFLGSIIWFAFAPDFEPGIAIVTTLSTFLASIYTSKSQKCEKQVNQNQKVGNNSVGIQAGGNVTMGSINKKEELKDVE